MSINEIMLRAVRLGKETFEGLQETLTMANTSAFCPRCGRKSLEVIPSSGRVYCLYAADCGYSS